MQNNFEDLQKTTRMMTMTTTIVINIHVSFVSLQWLSGKEKKRKRKDNARTMLSGT
jgi:hypothetical protein